jgi:hypothetical protein
MLFTLLCTTAKARPAKVGFQKNSAGTSASNTLKCHGEPFIEERAYLAKSIR